MSGARNRSAPRASKAKPDTANDIYNYRFDGFDDVSFVETPWKMEMRCKILGIPRPTYRATFTNSNSGKPWAYNPRPGYTESFKNAVQAAMSSAPLQFDLTCSDKPVDLSINFYFTRPKKHYTYSNGKLVVADDAPYFVTKAPDVDNCVKLVMDAMSKMLYKDDRTVAVLKSQKLWLQAPATVYTPNQDSHGVTIFRLTQLKRNIKPVAAA